MAKQAISDEELEHEFEYNGQFGEKALVFLKKHKHFPQIILLGSISALMVMIFYIGVLMSTPPTVETVLAFMTVELSMIFLALGLLVVLGVMQGRADLVLRTRMMRELTPEDLKFVKDYLRQVE
jgi:hypothetical protein